VPTAYSPASTVGQFLKQHQIPQETFAGIVGLSTGATSEFLTGKKELPSNLAERWLETIATMRSFIERIAPLPINWHPRLGSVLKNILRDFEKRQLLVSVVDLGPKTTVSDEIARAASYLADLTTNKS
jgi:hypothetical protein